MIDWDPIDEGDEQRPVLIDFDASFFVPLPLSDADYELFEKRMYAAARTTLQNIYHTQRKPIQ